MTPTFYPGRPVMFNKIYDGNDSAVCHERARLTAHVLANSETNRLYFGDLTEVYIVGLSRPPHQAVGDDPPIILQPPVFLPSLSTLCSCGTEFRESLFSWTVRRSHRQVRR